MLIFNLILQNRLLRNLKLHCKTGEPKDVTSTIIILESNLRRVVVGFATNEILKLNAIVSLKRHQINPLDGFLV